MNYFTSCIYGDLEKYMSIKKDVNLRDDDRLFILGDILDGNDEDPGQAIEIMDDIINSENVTLILGDHEYARVMRFVCRGDEQQAEVWDSFSTGFDVPGDVFNNFIEQELSPQMKEHYFGEFLMSCEISDVQKIGGRYFYLVHGKPSSFAPSIESQWQIVSVTKLPDFSTPIWRSIKTDGVAIPHIRDSVMPMSEENTFAVTGQMSSKEASEILGLNGEGTGVTFAQKTICLGRHYTDELINVIGIDAAGIVLVGRY